jgi:hypothetical protein
LKDHLCIIVYAPSDWQSSTANRSFFSVLLGFEAEAGVTQYVFHHSQSLIFHPFVDNIVESLSSRWSSNLTKALPSSIHDLVAYYLNKPLENGKVPLSHADMPKIVSANHGNRRVSCSEKDLESLFRPSEDEDEVASHLSLSLPCLEPSLLLRLMVLRCHSSSFGTTKSPVSLYLQEKSSGTLIETRSQVF